MDKTIYIPTPVAVPMLFLRWPVMLLVATAIWGEARGEPFSAKVGVAWVIENRVNGAKHYGSNHREVILKPKQFSAFNADDSNRNKMKNPLMYDNFVSWKDSWRAATLVLEKKVEDPVDGATHYHSRPKRPPYWAKKLTFIRQIGNLYFFRE